MPIPISACHPCKGRVGGITPSWGPAPGQVAEEWDRCKWTPRKSVKTPHQSHTYSDQFFRRHFHSLHVVFWFFIFLIVSARDRVLDWACAKQVWQTGRWVLQKIPFSRFLPKRQQNTLPHMHMTLLHFTCPMTAPWWASPCHTLQCAQRLIVQL